jgi:hypothetical protein
MQSLAAAGMNDQLQQARESMARVFPLTKDLWLDWIRDEQQRAIAPETKLAVLDLYMRASKDYLDMELWTLYVENALECYAQDEGKCVFTTEVMRQCLTRAVHATSHVIPTSHTVWNAYRDFEEGLLNDHYTTENMLRVKEMYNARLGIMHQNIEHTFSRYSSLITRYDNAHYEENMVAANAKYSSTRARLLLREPHEQLLTSTDMSLFAVQKYVQFELAQKPVDLNAVRCLYERAASTHCLNPVFWEEFILFMDHHVKDLSETTSVLRRAVRNAPWSGTLWGLFVLIKARHDKPLEELNGIVQESLASGLVQSSPTDLEALLVMRMTCVKAKLDISCTAVSLGDDIHSHHTPSGQERVRRVAAVAPNGQSIDVQGGGTVGCHGNQA